MKKGITLVELMIVMVLIAIILPAVSSVYIKGMQTFRTELSQSQLQSDAQTILDEILNDVKNGQSIETSYNNDQFTTGQNSIIIKIPALDSNQNILYTGTNMRFDRVIYYFEGNSIHKVVYADSGSTRYANNGIDKVLAKNVLVLSFSFEPIDSPTLITVNVSNNTSIGQNERTVSITGQARLRNHI